MGKRGYICEDTDYGKLHVDTGFNTDKGYKMYHCTCKVCGSKIICYSSQIAELKDYGCVNCKKKAAQEKAVQEYRTHIGEIYGNLEIIDYAGIKKMSKNSKPTCIMLCKCNKCGSVSEIPFTRLKQGGASECRGCCKKNLEIGHELVKKSAKGGSTLIAVDGRRKTNTNNTSGYTGVSYHSKTGSYRACINFQRKQYHLGLYKNIENAIEARKNAEKEIYGDFIEWYKKTYPEYWEELEKKSKR